MSFSLGGLQYRPNEKFKELRKLLDNSNPLPKAKNIYGEAEKFIGYLYVTH